MAECVLVESAADLLAVSWSALLVGAMVGVAAGGCLASRLDRAFARADAEDGCDGR